MCIHREGDGSRTDLSSEKWYKPSSPVPSTSQQQSTRQRGKQQYCHFRLLVNRLPFDVDYSRTSDTLSRPDHGPFGPWGLKATALLPSLSFLPLHFRLLFFPSQKVNLSFLWIKINLNRTNSTEKFLYMWKLSAAICSRTISLSNGVYM